MRRATVARLRPYTPKELEQIATQLSQLYAQAERAILSILDRGDITSWNRAFKRQQLSQIRAVLAQLNGHTTQWARYHLPTLYQHGMRISDGHLMPGGLSKLAHPGEVTPMDLGMTRMHQRAIGVLAENTATQLGEANSFCAQRIEDMIARAQRIAKVAGRDTARTSVLSSSMAEQLAIRDTSLGAMQQAFAQGQTSKQAAKAFNAKLRQQGITSFTDKAGKRWNMQTYSDMIARTVSQESQRHGSQNRLIERGYDLVEISSHANACDLCEPWQGEIVSLSGDDTAHASMADAVAEGLFHPNCGHAVEPYVTSPPST
ncbi:MAG TPA: phage minor capsid protein [Anaerolineae bacterium]|nr:phage minor capsid protein [Anaerolineae bacterium]